MNKNLINKLAETPKSKKNRFKNEKPIIGKEWIVFSLATISFDTSCIGENLLSFNVLEFKTLLVSFFFKRCTSWLK